MPRAVGFRAHTGWAAAVFIDRGELSHRCRVELLPGGDRDRAWGQAYHRARDAGQQAAAGIVAEVEGAAEELAGLFLDQMGGGGLDAVGVVLGNLGELPQFDKVLASHTLCHAAEGVLFREAIIAAANARDLPVVARAERDTKAFAATSADLARLGRTAGPPWAEDQKLAAAMALLALGADDGG